VAGVTDNDAIGLFIDSMDDLRDTALVEGDSTDLSPEVIPASALPADSLEPVMAAVALLTAAAAGLLLLPQSQLVTEIPALGFSAGGFEGVSLA